MTVFLSIALSRENIGSENDEAADGERGVDADHDPRDPPLEDMC
jgi:hypothetical protein